MTRQCLFITMRNVFILILQATNFLGIFDKKKKKALDKTIVKKVKKGVIFLVESSALP